MPCMRRMRIKGAWAPSLKRAPALDAARDAGYTPKHWRTMAGWTVEDDKLVSGFFNEAPTTA